MAEERMHHDYSIADTKKAILELHRRLELIEIAYSSDAPLLDTKSPDNTGDSEMTFADNYPRKDQAIAILNEISVAVKDSGAKDVASLQYYIDRPDLALVTLRHISDLFFDKEMIGKKYGEHDSSEVSCKKLLELYKYFADPKTQRELYQIGINLRIDESPLGHEYGVFVNTSNHLYKPISAIIKQIPNDTVEAPLIDEFLGSMENLFNDYGFFYDINGKDIKSVKKYLKTLEKILQDKKNPLLEPIFDYLDKHKKAHNKPKPNSSRVGTFLVNVGQKLGGATNTGNAKVHNRR